MLSRFANNNDTADGKTMNIGYGRRPESNTMISKNFLRQKGLPVSRIAGSLPRYSLESAEEKSNTVNTDLTYVPQQSLLRSPQPDLPSHNVAQRELPKNHIQTTKVLTTPSSNNTLRNPVDRTTTGAQTEIGTPEIYQQQRPVRIDTQDIADRVYYLMQRDLIIESERTRRSEV